MGGMLARRTRILTIQTQFVENQAVVPVRAAARNTSKPANPRTTKQSRCVGVIVCPF